MDDLPKQQDSREIAPPGPPQIRTCGIPASVVLCVIDIRGPLTRGYLLLVVAMTSMILKALSVSGHSESGRLAMSFMSPGHTTVRTRLPPKLRLLKMPTPHPHQRGRCRASTQVSRVTAFQRTTRPGAHRQRQTELASQYSAIAHRLRNVPANEARCQQVPPPAPGYIRSRI